MVLGQENGDPVCRAFLLWGECPRGNDCKWVHPVQQEAMWAPQCLPVPMHAMPIIGIVQVNEQGPMEWMPYYYESGEGSPGAASSEQTPCSQPGGFNADAFFQQARDAEAAQLDGMPSSTHEEGAAGAEGVVQVPEVTLEEMSNRTESWDQFEANERMFGVTSTYNEDLSQYSTELKLSKIPAGVKHEADRLALEIQNDNKIAGRSDDDCRNSDDVSTDDEENRFSAVCRDEQPWPQAPAVWD